MSITKITNKLNLPDTLVKACMADNYKVAGDISTTQLIDSARIVRLKRMNDYTEDVSDRLYSLMGQALHQILERANISNVRQRAFLMTIETLQEKYKNVTDDAKKEGMNKVINYLSKCIPILFPEVDDRYLYEVTQRSQIGDKVLYGTPDLFDKTTGILYDYKFCSTFMYTKVEARNKWEAQTNIYAWLLTQAGYEVKEIRVVAFFRDWQSSGFNKGKDYPDSQIKEIVMKLRPPSETLTYITKRLAAHVKAEETGELPFCTGRDRWATADQWVVKTPTAKKALAVKPSELECQQFINDNHHRIENMFIEKRPGESTRCERFCPVKEFCDQYAAEKEARRKESDNE